MYIPLYRRCNLVTYTKIHETAERAVFYWQNMKEQQYYVLTQDTGGILNSLRSNAIPTERTAAADMYLNELTNGLKDTLDLEAFRVITFNESKINNALQSKVTSLFEADKESICICLDRFLLQDLKEDERFKNRFFRFSMCRTVDGRKIPRLQNPSFKEQFSQIKSAVPDLDRKNVVIVDDGLFSGGTVKTFIDLSKQNDTDLKIKKVIGFIGSEKPASNLDIEIEQIVSPLYEWIDIRDFGVFGGKTLKTSKSGNVASAVPYIAPWSEGKDASLDLTPGFFDFSTNAINALQKLLEKMESTDGRKLTFQDVVKNGFTLPTSETRNIPLSLKMKVSDYLNECTTFIENERNREVCIFDMDGTLYSLDGKDGGFDGSTLEQTVAGNAIRFIIEREKCTLTQAKRIFDAGVSDTIGVSRFLSFRYGISRSDYFNTTWNINPDDIAQNFEGTKSTLSTLKEQKPNAKFILLTAAPQAWALNLLEYLDVCALFEKVYTGEMYGTKDEIFGMLAARYKPENMLSIGDQQKTDIEPAQKLGMKTLLVTSPLDLKQIL